MYKKSLYNYIIMKIGENYEKFKNTFILNNNSIYTNHTR